MSYTDVFSGSNIKTSSVGYSSVSLTGDVTYDWPLETSLDPVITDIMDVVSDQDNRVMVLPDAREVSEGQAFLINNKGSYIVNLNDHLGTQVGSLSPGSVYQFYLTDNSTEEGTWEVFQFGAAISAPEVTSLAGTGLTAVGTLLSPTIPSSEISSDYSTGIQDRAKLIVWTGSTGTLTLPTAASVGNAWYIHVKNAGTGALTVACQVGDTVDGGTTKAFSIDESATIVSGGGTAYYTIGFGQDSEFIFDYTSIDVAGTGDYVLDPAEQNRIAYRFTGILTGNRSIIVPGVAQQYWVDNATTGAFTLTIKVAAQTGISIASGQRAIFYCNGTDIVDADTSTVSIPIQVSQGGTSAITADAALVNLGGTATGISVFKSVDSAAVLSNLSGGATGIAVFQDASAADVRATIGLGTIAAQDASAVTITGGTATLTGLTTTNLTLGATALTATAAELNHLDGITSTVTELNKLDGFTGTFDDLNYAKDLRATGVTTAELDKLDGFTGTAADLNYAAALNATGVTSTEFNTALDGITATAAELNHLDGITSTVTELNKLDGFTGTVTDLNYAASLKATGVTSTEFNTALDGITATAVELNHLDGITSTVTELNKVDGYLGTATELNYAKSLYDTGVTSTEFNAALDGITAAASELNLLDGSSNTGWKIMISGSDLVFKYNGVNRLKLGSDGTLIVEGNVTAYGSA